MAFDAETMRLQKEYFRAKLAGERQMVDVVRKVKGEGQGDFTLLDTRDRGSYAKGHIPGAVSAPLEEIPALSAKFSKEKEYVTYCWHRT